MQQENQFYTFIKKKGYISSSEFNTDSKSLMKLVRFVQNLEPSPQSFEIAKSLIKFYRIPILIAFQKFYNKLKENYTENVQKYENQIKQIASYVKSYLDNFKLEQLSFFYIIGIGKKKKPLQKSPQQIQFIQYIYELGKDITKLKLNSKNMKPEDLKLELDSILARSLNRKMNPLQRNYEQYFKKQADKIYHQNRKQIEEELQSKDFSKKGLELKPEHSQPPVQHICCRRFFYDRQIIKEPQNLVLQYKNYSFPFDDTRNMILKKTICAFLNTNGGIVFLGIHQNVDNKMRRVIGMQLNQSDKERLLFSIRRIAQDIQPDIISNKMYAVEYIPVRSSTSPYNFISGRFLAKIIVKYGNRDEIYSYKHDKKDHFSFRTQNQVIHRQGRQVLNAYRERIKNPLPEPVPLHSGPCQSPQQGSQIYQKSSQNYIDNKGSQFSRIANKKMRYKQKDAMDYIILSIKQKDLIKSFTQKNLMKSIDMKYDEENKSIYLKVVNHKDKDEIAAVLNWLENKNMLKLFKVERGLTVSKDMMGMVHDLLKMNHINYEFSNTNQFKFKNTEEAIKIFLYLLECELNPHFICV